MIKINVAVVSAISAVAISVGGVLIGVGSMVATQNVHGQGISENKEAIGEIEETLQSRMNRMQDQMREDKRELLKAIREIK